MQCKDCRFAEWQKTASGRLSPTGAGRCTWKKTFLVPPQSFRYPDGKMTITNSQGLWRNEHNLPCPVGEKKEG